MSDDLRKKAFDFASQTTKQLITLSTGLIALSITFKGNFSGGNETLLLVCWILFFLSVLFGIGTLMALTGTLEKCTTDKDVDLSIYGSNVKRPSAIQIFFFLGGLLCLGIYGGQSVFTEDKTKEDEKDKLKIIEHCEYEVIPKSICDTITVKDKCNDD